MSEATDIAKSSVEEYISVKSELKAFSQFLQSRINAIGNEHIHQIDRNLKAIAPELHHATTIVEELSAHPLVDAFHYPKNTDQEAVVYIYPKEGEDEDAVLQEVNTLLANHRSIGSHLLQAKLYQLFALSLNVTIRSKEQLNSYAVLTQMVEYIHGFFLPSHRANNSLLSGSTQLSHVDFSIALEQAVELIRSEQVSFQSAFSVKPSKQVYWNTSMFPVLDLNTSCITLKQGERTEAFKGKELSLFLRLKDTLGSPTPTLNTEEKSKEENRITKGSPMQLRAHHKQQEIVVLFELFKERVLQNISQNEALLQSVGRLQGLEKLWSSFAAWKKSSGRQIPEQDAFQQYMHAHWDQKAGGIASIQIVDRIERRKKAYHQLALFGLNGQELFHLLEGKGTEKETRYIESLLPELPEIIQEKHQAYPHFEESMLGEHKGFERFVLDLAGLPKVKKELGLYAFKHPWESFKERPQVKAIETLQAEQDLFYYGQFSNCYEPISDGWNITNFLGKPLLSVRHPHATQIQSALENCINQVQPLLFIDHGLLEVETSAEKSFGFRVYLDELLIITQDNINSFEKSEALIADFKAQIQSIENYDLDAGSGSLTIQSQQFENWVIPQNGIATHANTPETIYHAFEKLNSEALSIEKQDQLFTALKQSGFQTSNGLTVVIADFHPVFFNGHIHWLKQLISEHAPLETEVQFVSCDFSKYAEISARINRILDRQEDAVEILTLRKVELIRSIYS